MVNLSFGCQTNMFINAYHRYFSRWDVYSPNFEAVIRESSKCDNLLYVYSIELKNIKIKRRVLDKVPRYGQNWGISMDFGGNPCGLKIGYLFLILHFVAMQKNRFCQKFVSVEVSVAPWKCFLFIMKWFMH